MHSKSMTDSNPAQSISASRNGGVAAALRLAEWLRLAATPTFAIMALLTSLGGSSMDMLCSFGHGASLSGMVTMYLLMSAFHSPPWLSLLCGAYPRTPAK
jgi:hypothetical protein